ncbi:MAG: hypothetical protein ACOY4O_02110 [Pseudomonadota bacterium]
MSWNSKSNAGFTRTKGQWRASATIPPGAPAGRFVADAGIKFTGNCVCSENFQPGRDRTFSDDMSGADRGGQQIDNVMHCAQPHRLIAGLSLKIILSVRCRNYKRSGRRAFRLSLITVKCCSNARPGPRPLRTRERFSGPRTGELVSSYTLGDAGCLERLQTADRIRPIWFSCGRRDPVQSLFKIAYDDAADGGIC